MKTSVVKKLICVLLCGSVLLTLCSCKKKDEEVKLDPLPTKVSVDVGGVLRLPFDYKDSEDPYTTTSDTNRYLVPLLYQGLFETDLSGEAQNVLASEVKDAYTKVTVTVSEKAVFSDGNPVTGEDVVYSFNCAKKTSVYKDRLKRVSGVEQSSENSVSFELKKGGADNLSLLDFPVVEKKDPTKGSGLYYLATNSDGKKVLVYNKYTSTKGKPKIDTIALVNCSDPSAILDMYNADSLDIFYDSMSLGSKRATVGKSGPCYLNNLIYLGLNSDNKYLGKQEFACGISDAVNQKELSESAYLGLGTATSTPYPSDRYDMGTVIVNSTGGDAASAKEHFEKAGYKYNSLGVKLLDGKKQVELKLLVVADNQLKMAIATEIKTELANVGLTVKIVSVGLDEFVSTVRAGKFDMYLGEVKLSEDYNLDCFFNGGDTSYGIDPTSKSCDTYKAYQKGSATLQGFVSSFCEENPFVPILFRHGLLYHSDRVTGDFQCTEKNLFYNIRSWEYAN